MDHDASFTAFTGHALLARGSLADVARAVHAAPDGVLVFDDLTGRVVDLDLRGTADEAVQRLAAPPPPRQRGRPKLGVVPREVTLLPRHWDWLSAQPGGASAALRRLVDEARRQDGGRALRRAAQERAYHFLSAMAGDLPRFEEASRALFAGDAERMQQQMQGWPPSIAEHVLRLAQAG